MPGSAVGLCRAYFILCLKMSFEYVERILSYVGKCRLSKCNEFYFMPENAVGVREIDFNLCRNMPFISGTSFILCLKMPFEYAERILSQIEIDRFIFQNVFLCTSLRTVSLRHKLPFDICLRIYALPALRPSLLHPFRYESLYRSFTHTISINFNSALA